jgi:hypothetical protein
VRLAHTRQRMAVTAALALAITGAGLAGGTPAHPAYAATTESIWSATAMPTTPDYTADSSPVELGVKFKANVSGSVTGVRFYKGAGNTGTHIGHLWPVGGGSPLATATFSGETASGWQSVNFPTPVQLTAGTTYVASYLAPVGNYAVDTGADPGGLTGAVNSANGDLTALASGSSGGNGVFTYTSDPNGAFPAGTFNSSNYWVDVLFSPGGTVPPPSVSHIYGASYVPAQSAANDPRPISLGVQFQSQTAGYISGIRFWKGAGNGGTHIGQLWTAKHTLLAQATFTGETASGWQDVRFSDMVPVSANTTYIASYFAPQGNYAFTGGGLSGGITNAPLVALPGSSTPGGNGVFSYGFVPQVPLTATTGSDYAVDVDFTATYTAPTAPQPTPRAGTRGASAVLVLTDPTNPFTDALCSAILVTKGLTCAATDTGNLTAASVLSPYHTVILANGAPLTASQVTLVTNWTTSGGNFIALRPNDNLSGLLGLGSRSGILADAYLGIDTSQAPGLGTTSTTLQYHGVADQRPLAGARAVATLYSSASTATTYPAVTTKAVGSGAASSWLFDLTRSNIYTREGNPGLAGQITTSNLSPSGPALPRVADRFGLGYLDTSKAAIPQADLQITLLANQIEAPAFPVPMKWLFPSYKPGANHPGGLLKAAFVLTGDDHASSSQTVNRFAAETAASPAGCSVTAWTCIRSTSYAYPGAFSDTTAKPYTDAGFEVSPHIADAGQCASNWSTQAQLDAIATTAINAWASSYPTISAAHPPLTQRLHCYGVWNDYASVARVESAHGLKASTDTSCWPNEAFNVSQCLLSGTALPQTMADTDGSLTGVNQFTTQATDEKPTTVSQTALGGLIANALGSNGYYGYFTVLAHLDNQAISNQTEQDVRTVAAANDVPVVSAAQAQTFANARAATTVSNPTYGTSTISFAVGTPATGLLMLQPVKYGTKTLTGITRGGTTVPFTSVTIGGVTYGAFLGATAGTYTASYN